MKRLIALQLIIGLVLVSCTANHYHDGKYKGRIFPDESTNGVFDAVFIINGDEILEERYAIFGELLSKERLSCIQYQNTIEYSEGNGARRIVTVLEDGSLQLSKSSILKKDY